MYSKSDLIIISKAIIENDYETINDNYKELSKYFTSLKVIVDNYMAIEEDNNPFWESRLNLTFVHNVICSFNYIEKPITSDDTDTIKVLIISDLHVGGIDDGLKYINDVYKIGTGKDTETKIYYIICDNHDIIAILNYDKVVYMNKEIIV